MKRIFAGICAVALALALCITSFAVTLDYQGREIKVGSLHNLEANVKYSWLNKLVLRDEATAVTTARLVPHAPYPYSRTYEEFMADVEDCMKLYSYDTDTAVSTYEDVVDLLYYTAVALDMTDDMDTMLASVSKQGVRIPVNMTSRDKINAAVIYAAQKYKLTNVLFDHDLKIAKGRSIDGAIVDILASAMGMTLPSGIDAIDELALHCAKVYAESYESLPMSDNPSKEEVFYLMEMLASAKAGYSVPVVEYDEATDVQKQYIDCTYYATVLDTVYDIKINPLLLAEVVAQNDVGQIARLILETMLDEDGVDYENEAELENLFKLACENGHFDMEEDFYSDVFNYDLSVDETCEKLWVTPFALANQLGGDEKFVTVRLGNKEMKPGSTSYYPLDKNEKQENMTVTVTYDDEDGISDMSIYVFKIIKEKATETTANSSVVAEIEKMLGDVVPSENEKAQEIVSGVVSAADNLVSEGQSAITPHTDATIKDDGKTTEATTYNVDEEVTASESTTLSDFEYFKQLVEGTYADKEQLTSNYERAEQAAKEKQVNVLSGVAAVVKENPEVVAAPTGVVAAGALAGYLFTRKKKSASNPDEGQNESNSSSDND